MDCLKGSMNPLLASVVALTLGAASLFAADTPAKPKTKTETPKAPARFVNDGNPEQPEVRRY